MPLDDEMLQMNPKRARRYFETRKLWIEERLPVHIQDPFVRLVMEDMIRVFREFVKAAPKTRVRLKYCTAACCKGKPQDERHGPYALTEWWDTSSGKGRWRVVPKTARTAATRAIEHAMERAAGRPERVPFSEPAPSPRPATRQESEAFADDLT